MAIHDENHESILKQIDDAKAKQLLYEHRVTRLENRSQYLANGDRRKRVHHLCNMGGAIQSLSPQADALPKPMFYEFMEEVFALSEVQQLLDDFSCRAAKPEDP